MSAVLSVSAELFRLALRLPGVSDYIFTLCFSKQVGCWALVEDITVGTRSSSLYTFHRT